MGICEHTVTAKKGTKKKYEKRPGDDVDTERIVSCVLIGPRCDDVDVDTERIVSCWTPDDCDILVTGKKYVTGYDEWEECPAQDVYGQFALRLRGVVASL